MPLDDISVSSGDTVSRNTPKGTLLVCDDEKGPRTSLKMVFQGEWDVLLCENGPQALDLAQRTSIDVAILDIKMAGMSGIEVLHHIKEIDPAVSVIMLTAHESLESAQQAIRLEATDYLTKPFEVDSLRAAVSKALKKRELLCQTREYSRKLRELQAEIRSQKLGGEIQRSRNEIYASVLHDLNTPLTVISGLAQLLERRFRNVESIEGESLEGLKTRLDQIRRQVVKCVEISNRYLSFLQDPSTGESHMELNQTLSDLDELLKFYPMARHHHITIRPLARETTVRINGTDLLQILLNLVRNALQCSQESHSVSVYAETLEAIPESGCSDPGTEHWEHVPVKISRRVIALSVEDDGPGIAASHLADIFRSNFTTKDPQQGTGLGLAIVSRLVQQNDCGLYVRSRPGAGALFRLFLPTQEGS